MVQKLKFRDLYINSRKEIKETLVHMWTGGLNEGDGNGYEQDMAKAIDEMFAPKDTMPIVQSMFTWEHMDGIDDISDPNVKANAVNAAIARARQLVRWDKNYAPFKHQYECWDQLLNTDKSVCVTTGTGSGKTECFMLPIIKKISEDRQPGVRAIFLYPLNALAEDQKSRLEEYLEQVDPADGNGNTTIKFAVYNGNTEESLDDDGTNGTSNNGTTYNHELTSRTAIRNNPPSILVTNPTMLEYIMLRDKDANLLNNSLEWFVVDETHTFKGAAAAELAMLIRRVLLASGITDPMRVKFVTSSATTGTGGDEALKKFIADISWRTPDDITIIGGKRKIEATNLSIADDLTVEVGNDTISITTARQSEIANNLLQDDFIQLDNLIIEGNSIEDKLACLDALCEKVNIKAKVLYFFQAPSRGLSTRLDSLTDDGRFEIINKHKSPDETPYVELVRCKKCGSILAQAQVEDTDDENGTTTYLRRKVEKSESFDIVNDVDDLQQDQDDDFGDDNSTQTRRKYKIWLFAPANDSNGTCKAERNIITFGEAGREGFNLKHTANMTCPCCHKHVVKENSIQTNEGHDGNDVNPTYLMPLAVGPMFMSRTLSRTILEQMTNMGVDNPHNGQQYLSFVDNRQAAAKLTLDQAKDLEEQWLQSRIFKILSNLNFSESDNEEYEYLKSIDEDNLTDEQVRRKNYLRKKKKNNGILHWSEIYDRLDKEYKDDIEHLVKQSLPQNENIEARKIEYLMTLMYEQLGSRKPNKDSLETLGMVQTYYPELEAMPWNEIAQRHALSSFNQTYCKEEITPDDWKDFVRMYVDYQLRSDASVFCDYRNEVDNGSKSQAWKDISITRFRRFATMQDRRRPALAPKPTGRFGRLLCMAAGWNNIKASKGRFTHISNDEDAAIKDVLNDIFQLLTTDRGFLKREPAYINKKGNWENENNDTWRLDIEKIAFKVYDRAYFCPVTKRIIPYTFMGYSPYTDGIPKKSEDIQEWIKFDFIPKDIDNIREWCDKHRSELGAISNRTARLFLPNLPVFVSAEHTAQVDKEILKIHQEHFKEHEINILTCSTTMEMGVNLGDLELVVMNSIPPHPANYKQRAGRSGRQSQNKSAAITFCGNDSIGKQTMADSLHNLILRPYSTPNVDFNSRQIIQRHVNSFLLRLSINNPLGEKVYNLFAEDGFGFREYQYDRSKGLPTTACFIGDRYYTPSHKLGNTQNSTYGTLINSFRNFDWNDQVNELLQSTPYYGDAQRFIADAIDMLENVKDELSKKIDNIAVCWTSFINSRNLPDSIGVLDGIAGKYPRLINHKYVDLLNEPLINYLATHQFTPNAAMPVCIVEFDKQDDSNWSRKRRPSYTLNRALSQYAPGKLVVLNNVCYRSAGVDWRNRFSNAGTGFKRIVEHNTGAVEIVERDDSTNNGTVFRRSYKMISPLSFCTDINVEENRISDGDIYTRTEAHLINVGSWGSSTTSKLIQSRGVEKGRTPEILFINTGKNGMGFCVCRRCGRAEIESRMETRDGTPPPPSFLLSIGNGNVETVMVDGQEVTCHLHISKLRENRCANNNLMRNVVFGDTIQTDYCELKLFKVSTGIAALPEPLDVRIGTKDFQILHTLGMLICDDMSKNLGIERGEIDYLITSIGTLCIYDLAKGGAGYSKKLLDYNVLFGCLDRIRELLNEHNEHGEWVFTSDQMIDSYTVYNEEYINLNDTRNWLDNEYGLRRNVPQIIQNIDHEASLCEDLKGRIVNALHENQNVTLFANWLSVTEDNYNSFKERNRCSWFKECTDNNTDICFHGYNTRYMPAFSLLHKIQANATLKKIDEESIPVGVYPVAIIGDNYYVTDNAEVSNLDENWGDYPVYIVNAPNPSPTLEALEIREPGQDNINKFILKKGFDIRTSELLNLVAEKDEKRIISEFFDRHINQDVDIIYEDQYLLSPFSLSIAVQVIKSVISRCNPSNVNVAIQMESFENKGKTGGMIRNMINDQERDCFLTNLCDGLGWVNFVETYPENLLPHWRVLAITAGNETLEIYPNGGFANGWYFSSNSDERYYAERLTHQDDMQIELENDIMFDIQLIRHNE